MFSLIREQLIIFADFYATRLPGWLFLGDNMLDKNIELAQKIAYEVSLHSGRAYFVGGYVRDTIRGVTVKDIDIEIHGLYPSELENILVNFGDVKKFGSAFGIYSINGYEIDIALPRKEVCVGVKHSDFDVLIDPFCGTLSACRRRDFTINSIMQDVLTGEIIDHFGGVKDIEDGIIRHIDDSTFTEDSLRVLRAAQFAARFEYKIAQETQELCRGICLKNLSKERVFDEMKKALLKSFKPSVFFNELKDMNQLDIWFLELKKTIGVKQNPVFHPEGDVWNHTMIVIDKAAFYRNRVDNPLGFMLLALCHDFGKITGSVETDGVIRSYKHEIIGLVDIKEFIRRITNEKNLLKYVINMTEHHMKPYIMAKDKSSVKATNKLFDGVASPIDIIYFALADNCGKESDTDFEDNKNFLFERLEVFLKLMEKPHITGEDLLNAGIKPGINYKELLCYAHKLRLACVDKDNAMKDVISYYKKISKNQSL